MTREELKRKLRAFPQPYERCRAELTARICGIAADKKNAYDCVRAMNYDGAPKARKINDPTYQKVWELNKRFDREIAEVTRSIHRVMDEQEIIQKALDWLRLKDIALYDIVYWKFIRVQKWRAAGRETDYTSEGARKNGSRALDMMVSWMKK